jgi:RNA polymerase-binding protein DksA
MKKSQLNRYRSRLLDLRERLTGAISRMSETVLTDDQPPGEHDRTVSEDTAKELVLEHDEETIRRQVMEALERIDCGTYGVCQECTAPIGLERLDAMPYTPYCIQCERKVEGGRA